jgi:YidC/Oxa1 family membrane protein insertase
MDKKNTLLGIIFIMAGVGFMYWQGKALEEQRRQEFLNQPLVEETAPQTAPADPAMVKPDQAPATPDAMLDLIVSEVTADESVPVAKSSVEESLVTLRNEFIEVEFTNLGGAIRTVSFLQSKSGGRDDYVFNQSGLHPALSLSLAANNGDLREFSLPYTVEKLSDSSVTYAFATKEGLIIRRKYTLSQTGDVEDPYIISHSSTFENTSATPKALSTLYLNLGTARPIIQNQQPNYLNVGYFDGEKAKFTDIRKLTGSGGFLGIGANEAQDFIKLGDDLLIEWSSVKNQFFAAVLSSETDAEALIIYPVEAEDVDGVPAQKGISGTVGYSLGIVNSGATQSLEFDYFVGPKEFKRLQALGNRQDEVMQFGFLSFISKLLLSFMYAIHVVVPSWGWSIVIMTICIKLVFWPLTAKASRSQKRMAKIQGPMAEMKEKYKDNPQRMQQETIKLFKEHQVNPVAGCLPMIVQMPIFLGLFYMLRTASELRHESFLWVADLSQPDTIAVVAGFPINLLPLIMGATMFLQMSMMPTSPTADPMQQKIFKFLPFIFLIFLYNFSSGLVVYWTVQNILTIIQQKIINSRPDEPLKPVAVANNGPIKKAKAVGPMAKGKSKKK